MARRRIRVEGKPRRRIVVRPSGPVRVLDIGAHLGGFLLDRSYIHLSEVYVAVDNQAPRFDFTKPEGVYDRVKHIMLARAFLSVKGKPSLKKVGKMVIGMKAEDTQGTYDEDLQRYLPLLMENDKIRAALAKPVGSYIVENECLYLKTVMDNPELLRLSVNDFLNTNISEDIRTKFLPRCGRLEFIVADGKHLDFEDKSFDIVFANCIDQDQEAGVHREGARLSRTGKVLDYNEDYVYERQC
jgi:hypothetical protein